MNWFNLTTLELRRYWSRPLNYLSIILIIGLSVGGSLFINGVLAFLVGNATETKLNLLSFTQLTQSFSISWLLILLYYCVQQLSSTINLDFSSRAYPLVFSKPINPYGYAISKVVYAMVQCLIFGLICAFTVVIASWLFNDKMYSTRDQIPAVIYFILAYIIPLQVVTGILVAILTLKLKNKSVTYYYYGLFLLIPVIISGLFSQFGVIYPTLTWLDPTGGLLLAEFIKYYTAGEVNSFSGNQLFTYNRIAWIVGSLVIALVYVREYNFEPKPTKDQESIVTPLLFHSASTRNNPTSSWEQFKTLLKYTFYSNLRKSGLYILASVCIGYYCFYAFTNFSIGSVSLYPTTSSVIIWIASATLLYTLIYIGYRLSVLFDYEKTQNTQSLLSSYPISQSTVYLSKIISVWLEVGIVTGLVTIIAIISQFYFKSPVSQPLELIFLFCINWLYFLFIITFSYLVLIVFRQSKLAFLAVLGLFVYPIFVSSVFNVTSNLLLASSKLNFDVNDFVGIGYGLDGILWTRTYWLGLTGVGLSIITLIGFKIDNTKNILRTLIHSKWLTSLTIISFVISGVTLMFLGNNNIQNYQRNDEITLANEYFAAFKDYAKADTLTVTKVSNDYDLYPKAGKMLIVGSYQMVNKTNVAITNVLVDIVDHKLIKSLKFDKPASISLNKPDLGADVYTFEKAIEPNEVVNMSFELGYARKSFSDYDSLDYRIIQQNGTFLDNSTLPQLGFNYYKVLQADKKDIESIKEYVDTFRANKNVFSSFANFISADISITTDQDQLAIAPGAKLSEQTLSGGRKKYVYSNPKMLFFLNILSSKLDTRTEEYKGVMIEISHHPKHTVNLDQILLAAKDSLDYYTTNFGPYPLKYLRIAEFGSGSYAQSFAGTVSFGDNLFIAKVDPGNNKKINYPYSITAHEIAHQWWGHQLVASQGAGSSFLTESLSEYSALQVIGKRFGQDSLVAYEKSNLDTYLKGRKSLESETSEKPLSEVGYFDNQGWVHYQKGSLVLNSIKTILGEAQFNNILKTYLTNNSTQPPFANYKDLINTIIQASPLDTASYVAESLNSVVMYDNSITKFNTTNIDGKYQTTIDLNLTKKKVQNGKYEETQFNPQEITIDSYINTKSNNYLDGQYIQTDRFNLGSGKQTVTIITSSKPDIIVLDKSIRYLDSNIRNNTAGSKPTTLLELFNDVEAITRSIGDL